MPCIITRRDRTATADARLGEAKGGIMRILDLNIEGMDETTVHAICKWDESSRFTSIIKHNSIIGHATMVLGSCYTRIFQYFSHLRPGDPGQEFG